MKTNEFPKPRSSSPLPKRHIPWPFRLLPERFFYPDEMLIQQCPVAYAKSVGNQVEREDEDAIRFALKKAKAKENPISKAMETEVSRQMLRIGSRILPLRKEFPVLRQRPPRDAFEKIAIEIAVSRTMAALNCGLTIKYVDEKGKPTPLAE